MGPRTERTTTCGECLAACGVVVDGHGGVRGDDAHPLSRGYLCANGRASVGLIDHPGRLRVARVRGAPVAWGVAMDGAVAGIRAAIERDGPDAVGLYFGAGDPAGSLAFLAASGFLQGLGSRRHYNVIGLEATHRYVVAEGMLGDPFRVLRPDVERAQSVLVLGSNPPVSNDEAGLAEELAWIRRRGATSIVVDPRRTELARHATLHLQARPGRDAEILLAMLHVVFSEGLAKDLSAFDGAVALRRLAGEMPPARAAEAAGVAVDDLVRAARLLAGSRPVCALTRLGVAMSRRATVNEWLAWSLVACLGSLGRPGGLVHNPGFLDMGAMLRRARPPAGSIVGVLPPGELADAILDGRPPLRALIVVAADPMESLPNTAKVARALARLDSLIVLDVAPTATTELATVVFPAAHHLEKEDVGLLLPDRVPERYARLSRRVASPPGEARSEVAILSELAARLGTPLFGSRAIDLLARGATILGGDRERPISPRGALRVLLPLLTRFSLTWRGLASGRRPERLADGAIPRGRRVDLAPPRFVDAARRLLAEDRAAEGRAAEAGALTLATCVRSRELLNGKLRLVGRRADGMVLHLHPDDAAALGVSSGDAVTVETRAGRASAIAELDDTLRPGFTAIPFGTPGLNRLTDDADVDPLSRIPALANVPCRITRVNP